MFSINYLRPRFDIFSINNIVKRFKSKHVNYLKEKRKINNTELALRHFDNFYSKIYDNRWQSIRLGLLSPKKYLAIVNNFVNDHEMIEIELRKIGAHNLRYLYNRNMKKLLKNIQKNEYLQSINDDNNNNDDVQNENNMKTSLLDSSSIESETESIESFFTDTQETQLDNNQATFNLDLNQFVPVTEMKFKEQIINDSDYYQFYDTDHINNVEFIEQNKLNMPLLLNLYLFPRNDFTEFPAAKLSNQNLFNYYLIDGASILPALLMNIEDDDYVGDFCAAPGGKSLLMYLQMKNCQFFLNDISKSRLLRLKNVFKSFIPNNRINQTITFENSDVMDLKRYNRFDKILVDVPCTNDKHSLFNNDNNIFSNIRLNERIQLPQKQLDILMEAMKSVRIGGNIIYSTCSLSPIQNDGVVHMALKQLEQLDSTIKFQIVNFKPALRPLEAIFRFDYQFRYGVQILPNICNNYGPMYLCKLLRVN